MADINDINAAQSIKIIGSDLTGVEQTPVSSTSDGKLKTEITFPANNYLSSSFGGLRTVTSQNVFESLFSFDKQPLVWDETLSGGATSTFNTNTNSIDMTLPTTSGASVVRQTFRRIRYNPARTVQILTAAILGEPKANVKKQIGQFDTNDGVFFEHDGLTVNVVRRTSTSGTPVDIKTAQSSWNIDKFDGTGISGITIDFSKHQLFYIQYAFQGFGDIVYGVYFQGRILYAHRETITNVSTQPSMRTPHLPCSVQFTNTATTASSTTLSYNSFTIKNEGEDADQEGQLRSYSSSPVKTVTTTVTPLTSIRLRPGYEKAIADVIKTTVFVNTADEVIWTIWLNPTLTGSTFANTSSYLSIDTAATAMTGGTEIISGILGQQTSSSITSLDLLKYANTFLGTAINGTTNIITIAARARAGTADVLETLVWREYP